MEIKGFENEDIEVSEFGEWVGHDYIDYKSDYKEHQKIINDLLKQRQELIEYLKEEINKVSEQIRNYDLWHEVGTDINFLILRKQMFKEILNKIEKR